MRLSPKRQRLIFVLGALGFSCAGVLVVLNAFQQNIVFFYTPAELAERRPAPDVFVRLGGLVKTGSVSRQDDALRFTVTDGQSSMQVDYAGVVPSLFREGQGVVAEGALRPDGNFAASRILAKHDENYMPKEVAEKLKANGYWKQEGKPHAP